MASCPSGSLEANDLEHLVEANRSASLQRQNSCIPEKRHERNRSFDGDSSSSTSSMSTHSGADGQPTDYMSSLTTSTSTLTSSIDSEGGDPFVESTTSTTTLRAPTSGPTFIDDSPGDAPDDGEGENAYSVSILRLFGV